MAFREVLVIGGGGAMGRHTVRALETLSAAERIVVGGLASEQARQFVDSCGPTVSFAEVDIDDAKGLENLMGPADLIINTAGPFYRLGEKVATAAINTRTDYIDICDDPEPTEALLSQHDKAAAAGVTVILGLGLSPGVSNLLAPLAMGALDSTSELDTTWDLSACEVVNDGPWSAAPKSGVGAATYHGMHMCSVAAKVLLDGEWSGIDPVESVDLSMPGNVALTGWTLAHPESITLPQSFPELRTSRNFMTGPDKVFRAMQSLRDAIRAGDVTAEQAARASAESGKARPLITLEEEAERLLAPREAEAPRNPPLFCAIARGRKDGRNAIAASWINRLPTGGMGAGTGTPPAIGAVLLSRGQLTVPAGVYAPEAALEPTAFFAMFENFCPTATNGRPLVETAVEFVD